MSAPDAFDLWIADQGDQVPTTFAAGDELVELDPIASFAAQVEAAGLASFQEQTGRLF